MKRLLLAISLALLSVSTVSASDHGRRHGHDDDDDRGHSRGKHKGHHKYRHDRDFHRGERIPQVYLERDYYVEDYRVYHLAPPPRGHRWVRTDDGKYILIAVATGIIADIILHH